MNFINRLSLTTTFCFCLSVSGAGFAELPQISDARVVQPPPGANVAAAYFTIKNPGSAPLEILDVDSDIAKRVEVHLSFVENDVAKMEKQESVIVPAGESLEFKHGSYHVMFMGLNDALVAGNSLDLTLNTNMGDLAIAVPVISLADATSMSHENHDTKTMNHDMQEAMPKVQMKDGMQSEHNETHDQNQSHK